MSDNFYKKQINVPRDIILGKNGSDAFGLIPRLFIALLAALLLITPAFIIKGVFDKWGIRYIASEFYVVIKLSLLILILLLDGSANSFSFWLSVVLLIDLNLYLFALVFLRRFWGPVKSLERSIFLMIFNFLELILAFAIIYIHTGSIGYDEEVLNSSWDSVYFSVVTITTLGYGEYHPNCLSGKIAVILQVMSAVIFFAVFLGSFVSRFSVKIVEKEPEKYESKFRRNWHRKKRGN